MKTYLLPMLLVLCVLLGYTSCRSEFSDVVTPDATQVDYSPLKDESSLDGDLYPELLQYYRNIATLANWYAEHPDRIERKKIDKEEKTKENEWGEVDEEYEEEENIFLSKLLDLKFEISYGEELGFFDLNPEYRAAFLAEMPKQEAESIYDKYDDVDDERRKERASFEAYLKDANDAFTAVFYSPSMQSGSATGDPYWKIRELMEDAEEQRENSPSNVQPMGLGAAAFWTAVFVASQIRVVNDYHPQTTSEALYGEIKPYVKRGRLLISVPGGYDTGHPVVHYLKSGRWDVGHVAVLSKNQDQVERDLIECRRQGSLLPYDLLSISIGTDRKKWMHEENFMEDWANLHPQTYVGQIFDVKYKFWYRNFFSWGWRREVRDVDNEEIFYQARKSLGTPYCNWFQVLTAKHAAPKRLMCSSAAWWYAKKGCKVNIGDWWKPTILPTGVYRSDRVRILN